MTLPRSKKKVRTKSSASQDLVARHIEKKAFDDLASLVENSKRSQKPKRCPSKGTGDKAVKRPKKVDFFSRLLGFKAFKLNKNDNDEPIKEYAGFIHDFDKKLAKGLKKIDQKYDIVKIKKPYFDSKKDRFETFGKQLKQYFMVNKTPKKFWTTELLSSLDTKTYMFLKDICQPEPLHKVKFEEIFEILDNHFLSASEEFTVSLISREAQKKVEPKCDEYNSLLDQFENNDFKKILWNDREWKENSWVYKVKSILTESHPSLLLSQKTENNIFIDNFQPDDTELVTKSKKSITFDEDLLSKSKKSVSFDPNLEKSDTVTDFDTEIKKIHVKILPFDPDSDWNDFKQKFNKYLVIKKVPYDQWVETLISKFNSNALKLLMELTHPDKPSDKNYSELVAILDDHFSPTGCDYEKFVVLTFDLNNDWPQFRDKIVEYMKFKKIPKEHWGVELLSRLDQETYKILSDYCLPEPPFKKSFDQLVWIFDNHKLVKPEKKVKVDEKKNQAAAFLSGLDEECYEVLKELCSPDKPENKSFQELVAIMDNYLKKRPKSRKVRRKRADTLWTMALLNGLSPKIYHLLNALCEPELPTKKSFDEIVRLLDSFLIPMPHRKYKEHDNFLYSRIPPFDSSQDWKLYRKSLKVNFKLFNIPKEKWSLALLSKLDDRIFRLVQNLCDPVPPNKKPFEELVGIIDSLFFPLKTAPETKTIEKEQWKDTLLKNMDKKTYQILEHLCSPSPIEDKTFEDLMALVEECYERKCYKKYQKQDVKIVQTGQTEAEKPLEDGKLQIENFDPKKESWADFKTNLIENFKFLNIPKEDWNCRLIKKLDENTLKVLQPKEKFEKKTYDELIAILDQHFDLKPKNWDLYKEQLLDRFEVLGVPKNKTSDLIKNLDHIVQDTSCKNDLQVPPFDLVKSQWPIYKERLKNYFAHSGTPKEKWVLSFLSVLSDGDYAILKNLTSPETPESKTFEELSQIVDAYYRRRPLDKQPDFNYLKNLQVSLISEIRSLKKAENEMAEDSLNNFKSCLQKEIDQLGFNVGQKRSRKKQNKKCKF